MCLMGRNFRFAASPLFAFAVALLCVSTAKAQDGSGVLITPNEVTMLVGQSRSFRLVDQSGHAQHGVSWNISDPGAFQASEGDDLTITARRAGDFQITANADGGSADATVKVMEGNSLPNGTAKWSSGSLPGCKNGKITPAVPSASGVDIYVQSLCEDGEYLSAFTADGILVWRHKIGGPGTSVIPSFADPHFATPAAEVQNGHDVPLTVQSAGWSSVCDSISAGVGEDAIHAMLHRRGLSVTQSGPDGRTWEIEESNATCELSFDENSVLVKKTKIYSNE
jgi:hypothetical protein